MNFCFASNFETQQSLPGDKFVNDCKVATTNAVDIQASASKVWPWLVQMGQNKAGFYSYSGLENLIGCKIKNANQIKPEWQKLSVGELVFLHPSANPLQVFLIEKDSHFVLVQDRPFLWSWSFVLVPKSVDACRLLVRTRAKWKGLLPGLLIWPGVKFAHYVMERKMLLGIKQRAEYNEGSILPT